MSGCHQGFVWVHDDIGEARLRALLPPEHRILAVRQHPDVGRAELLIEGNSLPLVVDGEAPEQVVLRLRLEFARADAAVQYFACWVHSPAVELPVHWVGRRPAPG